MATKENISSKHIYETIRDEIMCMKLEPGQFISEIETSKRFEVSRTPIRDVFKRLEYEGFLEIRPQKGTFVTLISLEHLSELMYMREKLEIAILKDIKDHITHAQLLKLRVYLAKQKKLLEEMLDEQVLAAEFIKSDNEFHKAIFEIAQKRGIWEAMSKTRPHYHRFRMLINLQNRETIQELYEDHMNIIEYLANEGCEEDIQAVYKKHVYGGLVNISDTIEEHGVFFSEFSRG